MHKPAEEYYLHDHGEGNGWQVASRGPGKFGVITTSTVNLHQDGLIELVLEKYIHGALSTVDTEHYMLTPEEALDIGQELINRAEEGETNAINTRVNKSSNQEVSV